jgi:hypothetical protein
MSMALLVREAAQKHLPKQTNCFISLTFFFVSQQKIWGSKSNQI